jgi:hypothetical protein
VHRGVVSFVEEGPAVAKDWCAWARCMDGVVGAGRSVRVAASSVAMEWIKWHVPYERCAWDTELVDVCCKVRVVSVV